MVIFQMRQFGASGRGETEPCRRQAQELDPRGLTCMIWECVWRCVNGAPSQCLGLSSGPTKELASIGFFLCDAGAESASGLGEFSANPHTPSEGQVWGIDSVSQGQLCVGSGTCLQSARLCSLCFRWEVLPLTGDVLHRHRDHHPGEANLLRVLGLNCD